MYFEKNDYYELLNNSDYNYALEAVLCPSTKIFVNEAVREVYQYSNENLRQLFANLNVYGKDVATVGSSGDQALNAIYYGAKNVTIIDACLTAEPYIELKKAAILNFDFETFNKFMVGDRIFDPRWYAKISHDLSYSAKMFWDNLYLDGGENDCDMSIRYMKRDMIQKFGSAFYDNAENYQKLQNSLRDKKFNYIQAEFGDFPEKLQGKYDLIMLSNIFDYFEPDRFFEIVKEIEDRHLIEGGVMQLHYVFGYNPAWDQAKQFQERLGKKVESLFVAKVHRIHSPILKVGNTINDEPSDKVLIRNDKDLFDKNSLSSREGYSENLLMEK